MSNEVMYFSNWHPSIFSGNDYNVIRHRELSVGIPLVSKCSCTGEWGTSYKLPDFDLHVQMLFQIFQTLDGP